MKIVGALVLAAEVAAEDGASNVYTSTVGTFAQCSGDSNIPLVNHYVGATTDVGGDDEDTPSAAAADAICFTNNSTTRGDDPAITTDQWPDYVFINKCEPYTAGTPAGTQMIPMNCKWGSTECAESLVGGDYTVGMLLGAAEITGSSAYILSSDTAQACGWTVTQDGLPVPADGGNANLFQTSNNAGDAAVLSNTNIFDPAIGPDNWQKCTDDADKGNCVNYVDADWNLALMGDTMFGFQGTSCSGPAVPVGYLTVPANDDATYGKCITMVPTTGVFPSYATPDGSKIISWNVDYNTTTTQEVGPNGERAYDGPCVEGAPTTWANATLDHGILGDVNPTMDDENLQYLLAGDCAVDTSSTYSYKLFVAVPEAWCPGGNCKQSKSSAAVFGTALIGALYALMH
jgi:hypothetical protein